MQKEQEVISMIKLLSDSIAFLIRLLNPLEKLATHVGILYTDQQILEKGLTIIRSIRDCKYALGQ